MDKKKWLIVFGIEAFVLLFGISFMVAFVDPYFHYHKPISSMFYQLDNQRSQNDGIIKQFDYDSIITGTSMCENFKASEFDALFQAQSVKICFSGGSYKEINDNLNRALNSGREIKYVLRCIDYMKLIEDKDHMPTNLGEHPTYLYDQDPWNDIKYLLNKEVVFNVCIPMLTDSYLHGKRGGITSFDEYSNWNKEVVFGKESVLGNRKGYTKSLKEKLFTWDDHEIVKGTIKQNVTELAESHPETTFFYFFPPYSIAYWGDLYENGGLNRQIEAEREAIKQILECENIKLYSFNDCWDIVLNLDNYKDNIHYGEWINTEILHMIRNDIGLLTKDNYEEYIEREREFYLDYNYQF